MSMYFAGEEEWNNPYSPPPMVTVEQANPPQRIEEESWWEKLLGKGVSDTKQGIFGPGGLVDIFGRQVRPPPGGTPVAPSPGVPIWVWIAIPVALVGVVALTRRRSSSVAGYRRRRRNRRSRR